MKIVIVGAGLGGLSAAFCFARKSGHAHEVVVLEQRTTLSPQGSGINIRPSATRILHSWGLKADLQGISEATPNVLLRDLKDGGIAMRTVVTNGSAVPDWGTHRSHLVKILYRRAVEAGAKIQFGTTAKSIQDDTGERSRPLIELSDGTRLEADLLLAADGIRSRIRDQILSYMLQEQGISQQAIAPNVSNITLYGFSLPEDRILRDPIAAQGLMGNAAINVWMGKHAFVVGRYNGQLKLWGGLFGIEGESSSEQKGLWDENGDISWVREFYRKHGTCRELMSVLEMADVCDRWKLAEMPNLPRWSNRNGNIILLGDSAHGMQPNAAQGYSMIVEDIGVLEFLIDEAGAKAVEKMSDLTRTWEEIRKPRAETIKDYARWNTAMYVGEPVATRHEVGHEVVRDLTHVKPNMHAKFGSAAFVKWTLDLDIVAEARRYVEGQKGAEPLTKARL